MNCTLSQTFRLNRHFVYATAAVGMVLEKVTKELQEVALQICTMHENEVVETAPQAVGFGLELQLCPQVRLHELAHLSKQQDLGERTHATCEIIMHDTHALHIKQA